MGGAVLGDGQRPDHRLEGMAAVEDARVKPADGPGVLRNNSTASSQ
jgi:hypothetical protein